MSHYLIVVFALSFLGNTNSNKQDNTSLIDYSIEMSADSIKPEVKNAQPPKEVFKVDEKMPRYPGCYDGNESEKMRCAQEKMLYFIYSGMTYPKKARKKGLEGTVVVRFTVDIDGSLQYVECVRDIGLGCGDEAVRVVKSMPKWEPGLQKGEPVKVQFNMPIKFMLNGGKK